MIDSLSKDQIAHIVMLGKWRDEGHCFAVGLNGGVNIHQADKGEYYVATKQWEGASRSQGPSGRQGAAGQSGAAAAPEPSGEDRFAELRSMYFEAMAEVREFYPDLRVIEVQDGIWVVTKILPIGCDGPNFSVCLFLHDSKFFDHKAFAFVGNGRTGKSVGPRHTNFPDASICSHIADDGVWHPGQSPLILLNLYAEWLICQLFHALEGTWPGRQSGLDATYRVIEFHDAEWCDCGSGLRYGQCHRDIDEKAVTLLKLSGRYVPLAPRQVPVSIVRFAKSGFLKPPLPMSFHLHDFQSQRDARLAQIKRAIGK